ncbi:alpha/beta fold hydrolase [Streptomyces bobili]|uniref:thioesterase II family protein n=1 Tax=Streptomyces bobili TaxID=67280 RepID=UPI0033D669BC
MTMHTPPGPGSWFAAPDPSPYAEAVLFVFPHAGGTAPLYRAWAETLPSTVDVRVLRLPGRQERLSEPPFTRLAPLLDELQEALEAELDGRPYLLFGHSFGGLLAYRLTVAMEQSDGEVPQLLAISGWAPGLSSSRELNLVYEMTDADLLTRVAELGLIPDGIPANRELLATVMPSLRGDFCVAADYRDDEVAVHCPVAAYSGTSDPLLVPDGPDAMSVWADRSETFLGSTEFPGGHFYLFEHAAAIHSSLDRHLRRQLAGTWPPSETSPTPRPSPLP